jgi:hypothetical protein
MRRWVIVLAVVFALSVFAAILADAATTTKMPAKSKAAVKAKCPTTAKSSTATKHWKGTTKHKKHAVAKHKMSAAAKKARGPMYTTKCRKVSKWVCPKKHRVKRMARPARIARGPAVTCPAPVVNVPQQAAPVVNVPQQPAPVVNVPASPPTVGITTDNCFIYIVRGDQLMVIDKNNYECKKTIPLQ